MCSRANIYAEAHADPVYPYLWLDGVHNVPGAVERMRRMLAAPDRPTWVIIANACDPQGIANRTIASHYEAIETIGNLIILKVDDDPTYR
jgi:hypothetical protein